MRSPFPGMDPYIETQMWEDFHARLAIGLADALNSDLPQNLRARIEKRVYFETKAGDFSGWYVPHVFVQARSGASVPRTEMTGGTLVKEPVVVPFKLEVREHEVRILDASRSHAIVTVIEIISPWNKRGDGRVEYQRKQREYLDGRANIVEIDLIRTGLPVTLGNRGAMGEWVDDSPSLDYHVSVFDSAADKLLCYTYPVRERLSGFRVPLRAGDVQPIVDLQTLVDATYDKGGYEDIDYARPLRPPLTPADAEWAKTLLADRVRPK